MEAPGLAAGGRATPPGRGRRLAAAVAVAAVALANLAVGARLPALLELTSVGQLTALDRAAAAYPREQVRLLVLGNSQALAGLRPPVVAEALGFGTDGAFSLALAGASPQELRLLVERHLPAFPGVTDVLLGVNESLLNTETELRVRYLSMGRPVERWWLGETKPAEDRLRLLVGAFLPILDFGASLHARALAQPKTTLLGLWRDPQDPDAAARRAFPWGLRPIWDGYTPRELRWLRVDGRSPARVEWRADGFTRLAHATAPSARQVGLLARGLRARGVRFWLAELPYTRALHAEIDRQAPGSARRWREALASLPVADRTPLIPAPPLPDALFYDADHLTPAGGRVLAAHLGRAIAARPTSLRVVPSGVAEMPLPRGVALAPPKAHRSRTGSR